MLLALCDVRVIGSHSFLLPVQLLHDPVCYVDIHTHAAGDAKNEVLTGVNKLGFDPAIYRANALQSLSYDPLRKQNIMLQVNSFCTCIQHCI